MHYLKLVISQLKKKPYIGIQTLITIRQCFCFIPLLLDAINNSYHIWTEGEVITLGL